MKNKILIVDDETDICELIDLNLRANGFSNIRTANDGQSAVDIAESWVPDLIVLDLMLPQIDGLTVCKILKANNLTRDITVIMLTAKGTENDIVSGFECGADDYVAKPFSNKVLIARIKAHLRNNEDIIIYKNLTIDSGSHLVKIDDYKIELTYTEFEILNSFARHPGHVYTRSALISMLRGDDGFDITERAIDFQIVNLRKKLGSFGENIETVRGVGYKLRG